MVAATLIDMARLPTSLTSCEYAPLKVAVPFDIVVLRCSAPSSSALPPSETPPVFLPMVKVSPCAGAPVMATVMPSKLIFAPAV
ncbi:hypothetical protein D3C84_1168560 [compost metagenome]